MNIDEMMMQKRCVDKMIQDIVVIYPNGAYRIEKRIEQDISGICGRHGELGKQTQQKHLLQFNAEEIMRILCFLLHEKACMAEAVSTCQKETNQEIVKIYADKYSCEILEIQEAYLSQISRLYQRPSGQKIQKTEGGCKVIETRTSKIDRALIDTLYRKCSQTCQDLQREKEECGRIEIDYEPAIDYTSHEFLGLDARLRKLAQKEVILCLEHKKIIRG